MDALERGLIHGFQTSLTAKYMLRTTYFGNSRKTAYIWQMTIPKGTEYIVGRCGEIGAKKMIFKKMLKMK